MTDERDDDAESDGLDAWIAAHFPPKPEETQPEEAQPVMPPAPPMPPLGPQPPTLQPPTLQPPTLQPPVPQHPEFTPPPVPSVEQALPGLPPDAEPLTPPAPGGFGWPEPSFPAPFPPAPAGPPSIPPQDLPAFPTMDAALSGPPPEPNLPDDPTEVFGVAGEASALDSLFGETKFRDYEAEPGPSQNPFATKVIVPAADVAADVEAPAAPRPPREGIATTQKTLMWIAGSLVAVLALGALFLVGTKLSDLLGPAPAIVVTPSATPTPTPTALPIGPVEPGDYAWDDLLGGECLDPYSGPWAEDFTVVGCDDPHPAQVVTRGVFGPDDDFLTRFPGIEALQSQVNLLCTAPTVIDYAAAGAYSDIQFEASYAVTDQEWVDGNRDYYCFVTRASGEPLTGSIAVPQVAPAPVEVPAP